jgi:hypothetical protein
MLVAHRANAPTPAAREDARHNNRLRWPDPLWPLECSMQLKRAMAGVSANTLEIDTFWREGAPMAPEYLPEGFTARLKAQQAQRGGLILVKGKARADWVGSTHHLGNASPPVRSRKTVNTCSIEGPGPVQRGPGHRTRSALSYRFGDVSLHKGTSVLELAIACFARSGSVTCRGTNDRSNK